MIAAALLLFGVHSGLLYGLHEFHGLMRVLLAIVALNCFGFGVFLLLKAGRAKA